MSGPTIELSHVSKRFQIPHERRTTMKEHVLHPFARTTYEVNTALDDVTLTVTEGEFFGVIGPNGSGKSTLLKIIARIHQPDAGTVVVRGRLSPFLELGVGFNPELTARDNVAINGTLLGLSRKELARRFDSIIAFSELERFVDQKLKNFSSGMQTRLAFSIAIHVDFDALLLDEVLAVGDQAFQEKCVVSFDQMKHAGKTIILISHDLNAISRFCDRAALLSAGRIIAEGDPSNVIDHYLGVSATQGAIGAT